MKEEIKIAGHGGQGVLSLGWLIAEAAQLEGKKVTWLPDYGPAMRGQTANCTVIISDEDIGSPLSEQPNVLMVMNKPSLEFVATVAPKGLVILNKSLVQWDNSRKGVRVVEVAAGELANQLGNPKVANVVILGAYLKKKKTIKVESVMVALADKFGHKKALFDLNIKALKLGYKTA